MSMYAVVNPATGEQIQEYPTITDAELEEAIARSDKTFSEWSRGTTLEDRIAKIRRVAEFHTERREELARIIGREMGKPMEQSLGEIDFCAAIYEYFCDNAPDFLKDEPINLLDGEGRALIRRGPIGPLLGIMPWNFPYYQVARFAAPNIVLGNTILLKHAGQCPESAIAIEKIYRDAGMPEGVYINLRLSNEQAADVIADPRVQGVSVTGSERAGAAVASVAGQHLKKVALELGGSDPFILLSTDDLDHAVQSAVDARLDNTGQSCNAAKRFIVHEDLYDSFLEKFTAAMTGAKLGDPFADDTVLGPLSSLTAAERLEEQVNRAVEQGATLVAGGTRDGAFYGSTVLTDVTEDMDAYREEFFGPVGVVYKVADEDEAVAVANDTPFGLGSYVFTTDEEQAQRIADKIDAGMVYVNVVLADEAGLPFGGVKRSGTSREMGLLAADEFVNKKLIRVAS